MTNPDKFVIHFFAYALLAGIVPAIVAYVAFQANLWRVVRCDDTEVQTFIYNHNDAGISALENIQEISFDKIAKRRTCRTMATAGGRKRQLTFVIDSSERGKVEPGIGVAGITPMIGGGTVKYSMTLSLQE